MIRLTLRLITCFIMRNDITRIRVICSTTQTNKQKQKQKQIAAKHPMRKVGIRKFGCSTQAGSSCRGVSFPQINGKPPNVLPGCCPPPPTVHPSERKAAASVSTAAPAATPTAAAAATPGPSNGVVRATTLLFQARLQSPVGQQTEGIDCDTEPADPKTLSQTRRRAQVGLVP